MYSAYIFIFYMQNIVYVFLAIAFLSYFLSISLHFCTFSPVPHTDHFFMEKSIPDSIFIYILAFFVSLSQEQMFKNLCFRITFLSQFWWTLWITRLKTHFSPKIAPKKMWITFYTHPCHFSFFRNMTPRFVHFLQSAQKTDTPAFFH